MKFLCLILLATSVTGRFTDDLYQQLARDNANKNLISSPLSVDIALGMVYIGAGGKTAQEMRSVLKLPEHKAAVHHKYWEFLTSLEGRERVAILVIANRIYVNRHFTINPLFNEVVKWTFNAEAKAINVYDPNRAASIINDWVNDQTSSRIKTIVSDKDITSDLVMILLNAIYFKGQWQYEFDPKRTKQADFRTADKKTVPVQMMSLSGAFKAGYIINLGAKVIELPYRNSSLSMVIFLPEKVDGLAELERKIAGFSRRLPKVNVNLKLPKFKIELTSELGDILQKMGIRDAFKPTADFKGLVGPRASGVRISQVRHKAFIEVNEEGAEAAAVTAVKMVRQCMGCGPLPPFQFNADHPFAYIIRDKDTIYFQGHFVKPE
ncbi:serine protease inhibitor 42Dd-like [Drosophila subpulchrella]|uniref:serine protease inhibitor 42Dd-like n=1 Tax=Drosophila subpulchrella TaxID=1486046 RepID=UPI0018A1A03B|nr:serine protease inhibitor 42Dd-like [Drosophila subpulchrella]